MSKRILKWRLPVDDQWHPIPGTALHCEVDADPDLVHVWAWESDRTTDEFCVFGTGHDIPDDTGWIGTTRHGPTGLVWHVVARRLVEGEA